MVRVIAQLPPSAGIFNQIDTKTHLEELGADESAIDQQVIRCCACEWSQSIDDDTLKTHTEKPKCESMEKNLNAKVDWNEKRWLPKEPIFKLKIL